MKRCGVFKYVLLCLIYFGACKLLGIYVDKLVFGGLLLALGFRFVRNPAMLIKKINIKFIWLLLVSLLSFVNAIELDLVFLSFRFLVTGWLIYEFFSDCYFDKNGYSSVFIPWLVLGLVSSLVSLTFVLTPSLMLKAVSLVVDEGSVNLIGYNLSRGRIIPIGAIYLFWFLPIFLLERKNLVDISRGLLMMLLGLGVGTVFLSNYRSVYVLVILVCLVLVANKKVKLSTLMLVSAVLVIVVVFSKSFFETSIVDRFLQKDSVDRISLESRKQYIIDALDSFRAKPFMGIGLGNFAIRFDPMVIESEGSRQVLPSTVVANPHNELFRWLAETGIMGLSAYLILLASFLATDIRRYIRKGYADWQVLFLVMVSWTYVIGSWMDSWPWYLFYNFCVTRGMLAAIYEERN